MKKIYIEPKLISTAVGILNHVMLNKSETPADPSQPVLGKGRDYDQDFDDEVDAINAAADTNDVWKNPLW